MFEDLKKSAHHIIVRNNRTTISPTENTLKLNVDAKYEPKPMTTYQNILGRRASCSGGDQITRGAIRYRVPSRGASKIADLVYPG